VPHVNTPCFASRSCFAHRGRLVAAWQKRAVSYLHAAHEKVERALQKYAETASEKYTVPV
jgi:hypothetical protein